MRAGSGDYGELGPSWWASIALTVPIMLVQAAGVGSIGSLVHGWVHGKYLLTRAQRLCLAGWALALVLSLCAQATLVISVIHDAPRHQPLQPSEILEAHEEAAERSIHEASSATADQSLHEPGVRGPSLPALLWTLSLTIATLCWQIVLNTEGRALAECRGFRDPLPLSRTSRGWELAEEASGDGCSCADTVGWSGVCAGASGASGYRSASGSGPLHSLLLGTVRVAAPSLFAVGRIKHANASFLPSISSEASLPLPNIPSTFKSHFPLENTTASSASKPRIGRAVDISEGGGTSYQQEAAPFGIELPPVRQYT